MTKLVEQDLERILDYLDGQLPVPEMIAHEVRLTHDEDLRASHEAFERIDLLQRAALGRRAGIQGAFRADRRDDRGPPTLWGRTIPVAALVLIVLGLRLLPGGMDPRGFDVVAVATAPTLLEFNQQLGLQAGDERKLPAGYASRGGDLTAVSDEEYLALITDPTRAWIAAALASDPGPIRAGHFVLPVHPGRSARVVVLLFTEDGRPVGARGEPGSIAYPAGTAWDDSSGLVEGGRVTVLPVENVTPRTDDAGAGLQYAPGFLVPLQSGRLHVLVGLRSAPLDEALRAEIGSALRSTEPSNGAEALARWQERLEDLGFRTATLVVLEDRG